MSRRITQNETVLRGHLREFVNSIINKDYAVANANLALAVKDKIRVKVQSTLKEN